MEKSEGLRLLIVGKEPATWGGAGPALAGVTRVSSADAAAERLVLEAFDAILLGPGVPGPAAHRLMEASPGTVVVAVADGNGANGQNGVTGGADAVLPADCPAELAGQLIRHAVEQQRLTRRLHESEARFRDIIERNADAIMVVDDTGTIRFVNAMAERLFGRAGGALVDTPFGFPLVAGETTELDLPLAGGARVVEMRVVESAWDGRPACLASLRDVTERKEAERSALELIREQAARAAAEDAAGRFRFLAECSSALASSLDYEATLASLPKLCVAGLSDWAVLYTVRDDGTVRRLEVAHRDASKSEVARMLRDLPFAPAADHPVLRVIEGRRPIVVQHVDGDQLASLALDPDHRELLEQLGASSYMIVPMVARDRALGAIALVSSDPEGSFGAADLELANDLALRAALALDNARLYHQAQEANQAKTDFIAVISHDLRTPLSSIIGYADLLTMGIPEPLPESGREHVGRVRTAANHLLYLIDELLAYARLDGGRESARAREVHAQQVLAEVSSVVQPLASERGLDLRVTQPDAPLIVHTDPDKLRQILVNLAWNAVKFTADGEIGLELSETADGIAFRVSDTGVGIEPEHIERIFQPFWQVRQTRRTPEDGTGLGLSVVRRLVEMLGGRVSVRSEVGRGSTFTVELPREAPATGALPDSEPDNREENGTGGGAGDPSAAEDAPVPVPARSHPAVDRLERGLIRIIDENADGMMVVDDEGTIRFANAAACELFGRSPDELMGAPFGFPLAARDATELDIVRQGREHVVELRAVDFEWEGSAAHLVSLRDITARRRAEEQQRRLALEQGRRVEAEKREQRSRFLADVSASLEQSLADEAALGPLVDVCCASRFVDWCAVDLLEDGEIVRRSASHDGGDLLLATPAEIDAASPLARPIDEAEAGRLGERLGGSWRGGSVLYVPLHTATDALGALLLARRSGAFDRADMDLAAEVGRRAAASIERARLYEEAQGAARAKSDFLAIVSHELRTPLNAVIGYSDLLLLGVMGEMNPSQAQLVQRVISSSRHLLGLVEEILTYTRMERGQEAVSLDAADVDAIVEETIDMVAPMANASGIAFRVTIERPGIDMVTDAGKLRQILTNLLANAVKYTDRGEVSLNVAEDGDDVLFRVRDTGIGMTTEQLERMYEPFWQAEPSHTRRHGGTGLGLTVALELTRLLRGRLEVRSDPGIGTEFTLRLPRHAA